MSNGWHLMLPVAHFVCCYGLFLLPRGDDFDDVGIGRVEFDFSRAGGECECSVCRNRGYFLQRIAFVIKHGDA